MKIVPEKIEAIFREKSLTWSFRWAMSRGMGCNMWMPSQPSTSDDIHANRLGYWVHLWLVCQCTVVFKVWCYQVAGEVCKGVPPPAMHLQYLIWCQSLTSKTTSPPAQGLQAGWWCWAEARRRQRQEASSSRSDFDVDSAHARLCVWKAERGLTNYIWLWTGSKNTTKEIP